MGKSAKKANVAVSPAKSAKKGWSRSPLVSGIDLYLERLFFYDIKKKGKRDADVALEKQENAKKIKRELGAVVKKPKVEEKEAPAKAPPKKPAVPVKKAPATVPKNDKVPAKPTVKESSSSEESSDDEPSAKVVGQTKKPPANAAKNGSVKAAAKKEESSDDSETESDSDGSDSSFEEDNKAATKASLQTKKVPAPESKKAAVVAAKKKANSSDSSSESEDEGSEEGDEETPQKKTTLSTKMDQGSDEDDTSDDSDDDSSEDEPTNKQQTKKDTDVKMVDGAPSANSNIKPQTPAAQKTGGSKTLFAGNLSYDVEKGHVEEFFKECGEVVDVRLSFDHEGNFKGYGHVEFATEEVAAKALELNGQELLGREIRLDMAREKGAYTPQNSNGNNSFQKGGRGQSQSLFIRGFDKSLEEDQIRSSLEEHFGSCGEITRISVPKDYESGAPKGIAYMDFKESDGLSKALELNGSELDGYSLTVEEARPKADGGSFSGGRGGGGRSGGGFSGGRSGGRGGRFGGRDGGGRFGGGRRGGGRGGGGRGRGTPYGAGKKKTFGDD
ncbi:Nucleolin 2 [Acorus gramineus]|uniref:Nucleolin 2 n=1 Tax=Acorus gramineus TaxID=55184 RepID=A0AAV9BMN1_ACOGR|nr:Nucleolin 2 [Acorus gramineus]